VKLGYNEQLGAGRFVRGLCTKHGFGTEKFVRYNRRFVITEFVITEFHCSSFELNSYKSYYKTSFMFRYKGSFELKSNCNISFICVLNSHLVITIIMF
jgi:hypothetical protein